MKNMTSNILLAFSLILLPLSSSASAAERLSYAQLQIKDYDEMQALVREHITKSKSGAKGLDEDDSAPADQESVDHLREALGLILSRPNQDNMLAKLLPEIRKELSNLNAFEDTLASLVNEAIIGLKNDKLPKARRATQLFVLENFLGEFRPEFKDREDLRKLATQIRDAKLEIPSIVQKELKMRSMLKLQSPSIRAKKILESIPPEKPTSPLPAAQGSELDD